MFSWDWFHPGGDKEVTDGFDILDNFDWTTLIVKAKPNSNPKRNCQSAKNESLGAPRYSNVQRKYVTSTFLPAGYTIKDTTFRCCSWNLVFYYSARASRRQVFFFSRFTFAFTSCRHVCICRHNFSSFFDTCMAKCRVSRVVRFNWRFNMTIEMSVVQSVQGLSPMQ